MTGGSVLGGLLKIAFAGALAWAWSQGHLGNIVAKTQAAFAGQPTTSPSPSSSGSGSTGATA